MKINTGILFALVVAGRLVSAAPVKWNSKEADAAYVLNPINCRGYNINLWYLAISAPGLLALRPI